jgi:hypothetical protein
VPEVLHEWRLARRLARAPDEAIGAEPTETAGQLRVRLRDGGEVTFEAGDDAAMLLAWLRSRPQRGAWPVGSAQ